MHVLDMIQFWARARPNYPAIIQSDMVVTYSGLDEAIETVSARIGEVDLDPREPVAVSIEHPAKQLVTIFALLRCGLTAAPVYPGVLPFLRGAGLTNLIYATQAQVLSGGRNIRFDDSWLPRTPSPKAKTRKRPDRYPDMIFFSSGTTGLPKKYIHTDEGFFERLKTTPLRDTEDSSRVLVMPATASTFGFYRACELFYAGKTACFSLPGELTLALINAYCIEEILASPQQILTLVDLIEKGASRYQLASLKSVGIGGGIASNALVRRVQANLCPQVKVIYGSTEAGVIAFGNYNTATDIANAVGYVLPWVTLEIVDDSGAVLPSGIEGYIRCRAPIFVKSKAQAGIKDGGACGIMGESGITELWIGVVPETKIDLGRLKQDLESDQKFNTRVDKILVLDNVPRNELGKIKRHELRAKLLAAKDQSMGHASGESRTTLTVRS